MTDKLICPFMSSAEKCLICEDGYLKISSSLDATIRMEYGSQYGNESNVINHMLDLAKKCMPTERCRAWVEYTDKSGECKRLK